MILQYVPAKICNNKEAQEVQDILIVTKHSLSSTVTATRRAISLQYITFIRIYHQIHIG